MTYTTIEYAVHEGVALVTLCRPERMNAWNEAMAIELSEAMRSADSDDSVRAVVVTGKGRAFCAGADLGSGGATWNANGTTAEMRRALTFPEVLPYHIRKPVFAAINGHAIGVGITYPMTCDVRIVAEDAKVQFAFVRRGIVPELASTAIVARVAGMSVAADLLLSGRQISGREFARLGLASEALPADQVLPATLERAREINKAAPVSVALTKRMLWKGLDMSVEDVARWEFPIFAWTGQQPDAAEGVTSFLERRDPQWKLSATNDFPDELA